MLNNHTLIKTLKRLKGNPKIAILIEPLWGIPMNLIAPYVSMYMALQGLSDVQIGLVASITVLGQVIGSFAGGIITDRFGRRNTTAFGDFLGWGIACLVWAISDRFVLFMIAGLLNAFENLNQTAWTCLLVEDADERDLDNIYAWVAIGGLIAVFFAPISGLFVNKFSVVPVVRVLYLLFALLMFIKAAITRFIMKETRQGEIRINETRGKPLMGTLLEYKKLVRDLFHDRGLLLVMFICIFNNIATIITTNFFALHVTLSLHISKGMLAFFPILRAAVILILMAIVQQKLKNNKSKRPMLVGILLYVIAQLLLIFAWKNGIGAIIVYTLLDALAYAVIMPKREAMLARFIDKNERARITSILTMIMIFASAPFGYIAGILSSIDRRFPFVINFILFIFMFFIAVKMKNEGYDSDDDRKKHQALDNYPQNRGVSTMEIAGK